MPSPMMLIGSERVCSLSMNRPRLGLSPKTIETYREHIKQKLNLSNSTELTRSAVQWVLEHGRQSVDDVPAV